MLRATTSIRAPATEALYSSSIISGSCSELTLIRIRARLPSAAAARDRADLLDEPAAHGERRDEDLAEPLRAAEPGQVVEEVGDVGGDVLVGREETEILVAACGQRVVVARCRCARSGAGRRLRGARSASSSRGS